jgi:uncharacterized membrane protein
MRRPRDWKPFAAAAALMLAGWLNLARGAAHPGVPYRPWAFDHHAYSDLLAMAGDRYFHGGRPTPYLEDRVEYPPLLAAALWLPSFVSRAPLAYFTVGYCALAALALATVLMLGRIPGASRWWFAGSPALAYYTGLNWDHLPIALLVAAVLAAARARLAAAGVLTGLGAAAKLFPVALLPPVLGSLAGRRAAGSLAGRPARGALAGRGERGGAARVALAALAAFVAVNLPVALAAPGAWAHFWRFNGARGAENSAWELLRHLPALAPLARDPAFLNAATALLLGLAAAYVAWTCARADDPGRAVRLGVAFVLVAWIATNKVYSPQYALYALVAGALASAPARLAALVSAIAVVDYHVAFESRASRGLVRPLDLVYSLEEAARTMVYALLAAWLARELWREARAAAAR